MSGNPCVFFDRDGVVNLPPSGRYLTSWEDFVFQPGIVNVLQMVKKRGYLSVLVTNQQGVARGLMTTKDLDNIHARMQEELRKNDATFDDIRACTEAAGPNSRRKPSPAMLLEAAQAFDINLERSWMIGDDDRDILAGKNAGVRTIRIRGDKPVNEEADLTVESVEKLHAVLEANLD